MEKQKVLVRTLYRKLLTETRRIPPNASLTRLDLSVFDFPAHHGVEDRDTLLSAIRTAFRASNQGDGDSKERVQRAMEGLRSLHGLDFDSLPNKSITSDKQEDPSLISHIIPLTDSKQWLEKVRWLDPLSGTKVATDDVNNESLVEFPVFPLSGPLFPIDGKCLPIVSQFSDVPVAGMEIPLKIFEPRYRQMYNDLFSSRSSSSPTSGVRSPTPTLRKCFIVPFSHPYRSGQFAQYGWLYEIMQVQDVADETNGKFQLVCNHLVTKPVKIHCIVNPQDYETRSTYLRAKATVLDDEQPSASDGLQPLDDLLRRLKYFHSKDPEKSLLLDRLLLALAEGSIWPVTQIWILNLQMQILDLQVEISNTIQIQALKALKTQASTVELQRNVSEEIVLLAQAPHKETLESMLMEVSTLVPLLLQDVSQEKQCQRLCERIEERLRL